MRARKARSFGSAVVRLLLCGACALFLATSPLDVAMAQVDTPQPSSCIPKGTDEPTYQWDRLHIVPRGDGTEMPTASSLEKLKPNQTSQIVLDPVRNVRVGFVSGVTLEAPAGTEDWTVVQTRTCPPARWAGAMAYDPVNDEIVLWGGTMSVDGPTDDVWIYDTTRRDWRRLENGSAEVRDLRERVGELRDDLETLRWDLWKALEWATTGKQGALPESVLAERLDSLKTDLQSIARDAAEAEPALSGYEALQAAGVRTWLESGAAELPNLGDGLRAATPSGLEADYRSLVTLRTDVRSAADSIRFAPPSRYFVTLVHDPSQDALVLESTIGSDYGDRWVYRLAARRWERTDPPPGAAVSPVVPTGELVLRDAATVAELQRWQRQAGAWAANMAPNTWVLAPAHGTGRPNWGRTWSSIVYDPDREQLYYRDGGHGSYHGNVTDHYDIRTGRWFRSDVEEVPSGRIMGTYFGWGRGYSYAPWAIHTYKWNLFYNPLTKHLQRPVFHTPDHLQGGNLNDYDPDQGKWSEEPASAKRIGPVVPGVPDGIVSVHGWLRYSGLPSATVGYATASGYIEWSNTGPIAFPGASADDGYAFIYDPRRERVMYYGGDGETLGLYALELRAAKPRWVKLDVSAAGGTLPKPYREWIYIPKHDVFLTMQHQPLGSAGPPKAWAFDPETNVFRPAPLALGEGVTTGEGHGHLKPVSVSAGLAYDPVSDVAFYIHAANGTPTMFAFRYVPVN